jgi:hypothetical protein
MKTAIPIQALLLTLTCFLASHIGYSQSNFINYNLAQLTPDTETEAWAPFYAAHTPPPVGAYGYTTSIGLRGGLTSGITLKHFVNSTQALEFVVGTRWHGLNLAGFYEWHSGRAFGARGLQWEYGIGVRVGVYEGRHYYRYLPGDCNDPNNPRCRGYWVGRSVTAVGLLAIGGLEYKFDDIPFTISADLIPYIYLNHVGNSFIDGSLSVRYVIK